LKVAGTLRVPSAQRLLLGDKCVGPCSPENVGARSPDRAPLLPVLVLCATAVSAVAWRLDSPMTCAAPSRIFCWATVRMLGHGLPTVSPFRLASPNGGRIECFQPRFTGLPRAAGLRPGVDAGYARPSQLLDPRLRGFSVSGLEPHRKLLDVLARSPDRALLRSSEGAYRSTPPSNPKRRPP
jgi:hypothetical protein